MSEMRELCERVCDELHQLEAKDWNAGNLEVICKLAETLKNLYKTEYYKQELGGGYSSARDRRVYNDGSSYAGRHYVRGHYSRKGREGSWDGYSRAYDRYMDNKTRYSNTGSTECKAQMMDALEDCMDEYADRLEALMKQADCADERETIRSYVDKLRNI